MESAELRELQGQLNRRFSERLRQAKAKRSLAAAEDGQVGDELDRIELEQMKEYYEGLASHDRQICEQILEALEHLRQGDFGLCRECGESIPLQRLRALPWAVRCLSCQQRYEAS